MNLADIFLATDIVNERRREAEQHALAVRAVNGSRSRGGRSSVRRLAARVFSQVSRSSAAAVRRLDDCIADDLTARLATSRRA